mgnify:CR=1 FL=1
MGIDNAHYYGWEGRLQSPWRSSLAIVRVALLQVFRRKSYWVVLALGLLQFLMFWGLIYAIKQVNFPQQVQDEILEFMGFEGAGATENGYVTFMQQQSVIVMILLAFAGSLLVGADFRMGSLPFYLSRRIDRRHYILGKLLAISTVVALMTVLPAILLFLEYGFLTASLDYWVDHWRIPVSVLVYGAVICTVLSILIVCVSAYLQRVAPIAITWSSIFVLLASMSRLLRRDGGSMYWGLVDPWRNMRYIGRLCFGTFETNEELNFALWALAIMTVVCGVALALLVRRVRAVEIVE